MTFVKYYPVLMQVIMLASIFDEFYPFSITNWLYPIYTKVMLDEAIKTISGMSERDIYMRILNAKSRESRAKERRGA